MFFLVAIFFAIIYPAYPLYNSEGHTYEPWTDTANNNRTYLLCPSSHCDEKLVNEYIEDCCQCSAKPVWELQPDLMGSLYIEYRDRRGRSLVFTTVLYRKFQYLGLVHTEGFVSRFPENICEFAEKLVKIDFSQNGVVNIENISCLINLDTLILTKNLITYVQNTTFSGLALLRVLDLSKNMIKEVEPMAISGTLTFIHFANFHDNVMETVDITNIIIENPFCIIDYSGNQINKLVNTVSFKMDPNKIYGNGGYVDFKNNLFQTWINFTELGFSDLTLFGKILHFGFDLRGANWTCDCKMQPFLQQVKLSLSLIWRDYYNITCSHPSELFGVSIANLTLNNRLDRLICNISTSNDCPVGCLCFEQPSEKRTVVNCTGAGLNAMPSKLPAYNNIELFLENNSIRELGERDYLSSIQRLEINDNPLQKITLGVAKKIKRNVILNFDCSELGSIPSTFKHLDQRKIRLGICNITCDCEAKWIKDWMGVRHDDSGKNAIFCKTSLGNTPLFTYDFDSLDCKSDGILTYVFIVLAALFILLSLGVLIMYKYRHEITLLRKNPTISRQNAPTFTYDVYIILNENNRDALVWTNTVLVPKLKSSGYITYLPYTDEPIGYVKEEHIIQMLSKSRDVIALLTTEFIATENDLNTFYTNLEWRHGWNKFMQDSSERNLIVINFDQLKTREFTPSPLKAFLRLNMTLDFADRDHTLMKDIMTRLGRPSRVNRKPVYKQTHRDKSHFIELYKETEKHNRKVNEENITFHVI